MKNILFALSIILVSCSSSTDPDPEENEVLYKAEINVMDASDWDQDGYTAASNTSIKIYNDDNLIRTITADSNGTANVSEDRIDEVCIIAEKDDKSNVVDGYIVKGVFESSSDIDASPSQENTAIGNAKFFDLNADGVVDESDKAECQTIELSLTKGEPITVFII